jgi:hypothetical protein
MSELWRVLRDPKVSTSLVLATVVVAGFALMYEGWRGAAALAFVPLQVPYLVSGALAGLAVVGAGLALLDVHVDRTQAAAERRAIADVQREVLRLLARVARDDT